MEIDKLESSRYVRRILSGTLAAPTPAASLSEAEYDRGLMHAYLRGGKNAAGVAALASLSPGFGRLIEARAARWSSSLTPYDGTMIGHDAIAAALASSPFTGAVSPSRLETYGTVLESVYQTGVHVDHRRSLGKRKAQRLGLCVARVQHRVPGRRCDLLGELGLAGARVTEQAEDLRRAALTRLLLQPARNGLERGILVGREHGATACLSRKAQAGIKEQSGNGVNRSDERQRGRRRP